MLTTAGTAFLTASLYEVARTARPDGGVASRNSTTCGPERPSHSGLSVVTTKSAPTAMVAVCAKMSQRLRMMLCRRCLGSGRLCPRRSARERRAAESWTPLYRDYCAKQPAAPARKPGRARLAVRFSERSEEFANYFRKSMNWSQKFGPTRAFLYNLPLLDDASSSKGPFP